MSAVNDLLHKVQQKNIFATFIIGVLVSVSYFALMLLFQQQEQNVEIIDIAGSQRMYSQKVTLLATRHYQGMSDGSVDEMNQGGLTTAAKEMKRNQVYLNQIARQRPSHFPVEVHEIYFKKSNSLNYQIDNFIIAANRLANASTIEEATAIFTHHFNPQVVEDLLNEIDLVVQLIEERDQEKTDTIRMFESLLWLGVIALLFSIYFWVFRPMQKAIASTYSELLASKALNEEINFAINKHAIVYRINMDPKGTITYVNNRFLEFYRYGEEEIIGRSVFNICSTTYTKEYYQEVFKVCVKEEFWNGESINKIKGGRELWLDTTLVPLKNNKQVIESFIVIQNDISGIKQTEIALNQLHQIISDISLDLDSKIQRLLALGQKLFNLPLAIVSEIYGNEYKVLHCRTPNNEISPGDKFELGNTYCFHTLTANKPLAFHHAGESAIKDHPCYQSFGLESYLGVPLVVAGKRFGTLNFSSPEIASRPFTEQELELIQLFSHWLSSELSRAQSQQELIAQQTLLEQMGQQARIGAWEVDLVNNLVYWSPITKEIHEVPADYQPDLETATNFYKEGESRNKIKALVEQSMIDGKPYQAELELVTAKGNNIWVSALGRTEFEGGKCVRMFGSFQDITDRINSQREIQEFNRRMSLAVDSAGIGIWELNLITNELKWDDWMFKIFGVKADEFSGAYEAWENGLHKDDKERAAKELKDAVEGNSKFDTQFRTVWPNGQIKHIKALAMVIKDGDGTPISMIGVNYDVTEAVENEIALRKSKDLAEVAVKAKNEFFASMSHEIRTPMNGVIGMLELVKDTQLTSEQKHRISVAQKSAKSLLSLINDILDFSKIDANKLEMASVVFDLCKMTGDLAESLAQQAQEKGLEIVLDLVEVKETMVIGDPNRVRQILTNLVGNAIKFSKQGEVIIRLSQELKGTDQWTTIIDVEDSGIGIPEDKIAHLFDAFSQVDGSNTREYGGTGLGLAIVKKLSQCMNGEVKVFSQIGKGSCFNCKIILERSSQYLSPQVPSTVANKSVLIIDKNTVHAAAICRQMQRWQLNGDVTVTIKQALDKIARKNASYDLVLIDYDIVQQAQDEYSQLRQHSRGKLIAMTPMTIQTEKAEFQQYRFDGYYPKPTTNRDLHYALSLLTEVNSVKVSTERPVIDIVKQWPDDLHILLVEDNRVNQAVALGVLKKLGIENVSLAVNGKDALHKLQQSEETKPFTFIFMDIQMPIMDGYQATQAIRAGEVGETYCNVPISAMTANAMVGDKEKCIAAGMNHYLTKPINSEEIIRVLKEVLT